MKKKYILLGIMLFVFTGCGKSIFEFTPSDEWETEWKRRGGYEKIVPYQKGFYYQNGENCFCYYDIDSKQSLILCNKKGCSHKNDSCFAKMTNFDLPVIHNDKLVFVNGLGRVMVSNPDHTAKKEVFTILEKSQEEGMIVLVDNYFSTDSHLYCNVSVMEHDERGELKTNEQRIYAIDWKTYEETEIARCNPEEYILEMMSARNDVLYYSRQNALSELYATAETWTQEDYQEAERRTEVEVFRRCVKEPEEVLVKHVQNGYVVTANDVVGVLYAECAGTGYWSMKNLVQFQQSDGTEKELFTAQGQDYLSIGFAGADVLKLYYTESKTVDLYDLNSMQELDVDWEEDGQSTSAWKVPTGFAVPKETLVDGAVYEYGHDWKVIPY